MYADAFVAIIAFGVLLIVFYGPWQSLCTDWARQTVFECRDQIFDLALAKKLDFDSEEYRIIRSSLERLIRFAHGLTLFRFAAFSRIKVTKQPNLREAIAKISDKDTRTAVEGAVARAHIAMLWMMVCKSVILLVVVGIARIIHPTKGWIQARAKTFESDLQAKADATCA